MSQKNANLLASYFTNSGDFLVSKSNGSVVASATTTERFSISLPNAHIQIRMQKACNCTVRVSLCVYICIKNESNKFNFFQNRFCLSLSFRF